MTPGEPVSGELIRWLGSAQCHIVTPKQNNNSASHRLSAWVKSENVDDWAGLWMRVDSGTKSVAFDNMQNRAIKGTTSWQNYAVVLDVPKDATGISFGVLVSKSGTVWLNSVQFEEVGMDVPVTNMWAGSASLQSSRLTLIGQRPGPANLNFEE